VAGAEVERSGSDLRRLEFLVPQGGVSRQEVDRARSADRQALGQLTRSQGTALQARASQSKVGVERQQAAAAQARIGKAQAAPASALLQLDDQRILAPSAGRIGSLSAQPGRQVQPGQPLMSLVSFNPWVVVTASADAVRPERGSWSRLPRC
jgi:multidrug resistance efflux pump